MCGICGTTLTGRQAKYCSSLCSSRGFNAARKADGRLREYNRRVTQQGNSYQRRRNAGLTGLRIVDCAVCGAPTGKVAMAGRERRVCSSMCRAYLRHGTWPTCTVPPRALTLSCASCAATFTTRRASAAYCSPACNERARRARRDYRKRGNGRREVIRRVDVFERDAWTCQLCGFPVKPDVLVPDFEAPTIDHVVPLSRGGAHVMDNVQTAHFLCNSLKSDVVLA